VKVDANFKNEIKQNKEIEGVKERKMILNFIIAPI
jgi:hypothetical protein